MDLRVLERIWVHEGYCFIPTIKGWEKDPVSGRYKAVRYSEGKGLKEDDTYEYLRKVHPLDMRTDFYFCPVQFRTPTRHKEYAVEHLNVLWADLDEANPRTIHPKPTIAWHSSKGHYQALWVLTEYLPTEEIEALNKALTYHVGADKSGWDLTQLLRIPGSYNFKRDSEHPDKCELLWDNGPVWESSAVKSIILTAISTDIPRGSSTSVDRSTTISSLIEGWRLNSRTRTLLYARDAPLGERSDRLWELEKLLVEAGMPVSLIVEIVKLTVWNKFKDRKDGDKQLLVETLKAEKEFRLSKASVTLEPVPVRTDSLLTFDAFMEQDIPAPDFMVEGFLQSSSVGICAGEPKTMKSTLMLDMALSVASGKPFLGLYKTKPNPVLYIQEENGEPDIKRRFLRIAYNRRVLVNTSIGFEPMPIPLYIMNNKGLNLQSADDRSFIDKCVEEQGIKLLILDPWYMMCGALNENDAGEVGQILKYITTIRNRFGCTVILVHHFKKGDASRGGQRMRGSSVFHSWIENGLYSEINKGKPANIIMEREFRAFPSNKGLNIVFNTTETSSIDYDVQVHDVSDEYLAKIRAGKVDTVEDTGVEDDAVTLVDIDSGMVDKGELSIALMVKMLKSRRFSRAECIKDYSASPSRVDELLKEALRIGGFIVTVPIRKVTSSKQIYSSERK